MVRLALRSALSDRAAEERVMLVDRWGWDEPRTKQAVAALSALGLDGHVAVVLGADDVVAERSFGNLPTVHLVPGAELSAYDVIRSDWVVFTDETLLAVSGIEIDETVVIEIDEETGDVTVEVVEEFIDTETGEEVIVVIEAEAEAEAETEAETDDTDTDDEAEAEVDEADGTAADDTTAAADEEGGSDA
jgi:hypothetical protein